MIKTPIPAPYELARHLDRSRRDFLRSTAGLALGTALMGGSPFVHGQAAAKKRKVIVITFGGGARDQETFAPEGQENIPSMLHTDASECPKQSLTMLGVSNPKMSKTRYSALLIRRKLLCQSLHTSTTIIYGRYHPLAVFALGNVKLWGV